ncbi:MAG: hypothetical protein HC802_07205 [Caldilineaceae bacterium]|nr:hypothetical protein [Caldilineaceae bacterium]
MTVFSLLTFNCFGGANWTTPRRLRALARELGQMAPEVVCLQEVQTHYAHRLLVHTCRSHPEHASVPSLYAPRGALLTLARLPLSQTHFVPYETQGEWLGPTLMDRLTQKGMLLTHLHHAGIPIIVINTHLLANYWANWRPESRPARQQQRQLQQLASLVRAQPSTALVLVAGDFNLPRSSWLYDDFLTHSGMSDLLTDDPRPTYRPFPGVPVRYALPIDFVFIRPPPDLRVQADADLCFNEKFAFADGRRGYLSDHLGVRVTLRWQVSTL